MSEKITREKGSTKPTPEQYGFAHRNSFDDCEGGWMYEGGEDEYYKALKKWEKDNRLNEDSSFEVQQEKKVPKNIGYGKGGDMVYI